MVAQRLATEAINAGSRDNITVAVLFLQPSSGTLERIYCEAPAAPQGAAEQCSRVEITRAFGVGASNRYWFEC